MTHRPRPVFAARRRRWAALGSVTLVTFLILVEDTAVSVALPSLRQELGLGLAGLEWVVNAYTLALAVLLLPAGRLADVRGRRRVFVTGVLVFCAGSLLAGAAAAPWVLFAARAAQGAGAALTLPAGLAIISEAFPERQRGAALGLWAGGSAVGLGLGPVLGAVVTDALGWRWVFFANVPLGLAAAAVAAAAIAESRDPAASRRVSPAAVLASGGALLALLLALTEGARAGWTSATTLALFAAAVVCATVFVRVERRSSAPLLDPALLRSRAFAGANAVGFLSTAVMCNLFFFLSLYFQLVLGQSALSAGLSLLPLTALIVLVAPLVGRFSDARAPRGPIVAGMGILALGLLLLSRLGTGSELALTLAWLAVAGVGMGLATTPTTAAALGALPEGRAGVGAAVFNLSRTVGLSVGIAMMGAILAARGTDVLAGAAADGGETFISGLSLALVVNAGIALVAAVLAAWTLRTPRADSPAPEPGAPTLGRQLDWRSGGRLRLVTEVGRRFGRGWRGLRARGGGELKPFEQ